MSKISLLLFVSAFYFKFSFAGTVVGNGGDPILHYLEATRFALTETLVKLRLEPKIFDTFCKNENYLDQVEKDFCREFTSEIMSEILELNRNPNKVSFVLRKDPLFVIGPDGEPMPVAARTLLGRDGPIEFHLDSIKLSAPKDLLQLVAHEFQHKVTYRGSSPADNLPIGPFHQGRLLLDAVASAIIKMALAFGKIGTEFVLRDSFECLIQTAGSQSGIRTSTQRWFFSSSLTNYKTSLGSLPSDPVLFVPDTLTSKVILQLSIADKDHCQNLADHSLRQSRVALLRVHNDDSIPSEVVAEEVYPGLNPLCEKNPSPLSIGFNSISFGCKYFGTQAIKGLNTAVP